MTLPIPEGASVLTLSPSFTVALWNTGGGGVTTVTLQAFNATGVAVTPQIELARAIDYGSSGSRVFGSALAQDDLGFSFKISGTSHSWYGGVTSSFSSQSHYTYLPIDDGRFVLGPGNLYVYGGGWDGSVIGVAGAATSIKAIGDAYLGVSFVSADRQALYQVFGKAGAVSDSGAISVVNGSGTIMGSEGHDVITGSSASDVITGGQGFDELTGGGGSDKFVFELNGTVDLVHDFTDLDYLVVLDKAGLPATGDNAVLTFFQKGGTLSWDADGDGGSGAPIAFGVLEGVDRIDSADLAAGVRPTFIKNVKADGSGDLTFKDWGNRSALQDTYSEFSSLGQVSRYTANFDDRTSTDAVYDVSATRPWSSTYAEFDAQGTLFRYSAVYDDKTQTIFSFDTTNTQVWQRIVTELDAAGRLSTASIVYDDGTRTERIYDVADTHPWSVEFRDFYATGAPKADVFYNADGSIYLG